MAFREHELGSLVRHQPREAQRRLLDAYAAEGYRHVETAARLKVSTRTLSRWVAELGIDERVRAARAKYRALAEAS